MKYDKLLDQTVFLTPKASTYWDDTCEHGYYKRMNLVRTIQCELFCRTLPVCLNLNLGSS